MRRMAVDPDTPVEVVASEWTMHVVAVIVLGGLGIGAYLLVDELIPDPPEPDDSESEGEDTGNGGEDSGNSTGVWNPPDQDDPGPGIWN